MEEVCLVHVGPDGKPTNTFPSDAAFDPAIISDTAEQNRTVIAEQACHTRYGINVERHGSFLCSPIVVGGRVTAYLYLTNTRFRGIFGEDELRIANYITTATGAALEKAEGFIQLRDLNLNLEKKVEDHTAAVVER